jgi:hypothetical protein
MREFHDNQRCLFRRVLHLDCENASAHARKKFRFVDNARAIAIMLASLPEP